MAVRDARATESFDLRKKVLRLETLYDVSRALNVLREEQALVDEIVARTVSLLDAERGFGVVFEEHGSPSVVSTVGLPSFPGALAAASDPFVLDLCRARGPLSRAGETVLGSPAGTVAGAPLVARDRVVGVVVALDREARGGPAADFDEGDRRFLESVAALAAPAIDALRQLRALGDSAGIRRVKEIVVRAAASRVGVLIRGESGTGKELVAKLLHAASPRRDGPFLALNCAAVPESLLEAELFGIERGVATGVEARPGKFELASGGTIFLDEIADAPLAIQAKLLRVLQEREIERIGGRRRVPVDVRVVAATNADLEKAIKERRFREDLYYRIRVVEIPLPPLRERHEDVPRLIGHFLSRIATRDGRRPKSLTREAVARLLDYPFPGNVRELENLLEGAVALVPGDTIEAGDLQLRGSRPVEGRDDSLDLATLEIHHIRRVLESVGGNKSEAARILGINRRTLYRKNVAN